MKWNNNISFTRNTLLISLLTTLVLPAHANEFWSQDRQWLLGDWNGQRQSLEQQGYKFNFSIMSQTAANLDGGYNNDHDILSAYQLSLGTQFDLAKIAGWENTQASLMITRRDGQSITLERVQDPRAGQFSSVQEIYGRGQSWRLSQAWIKKGFADNKFQFKIGRMGLGEDFNASQCEFQNLVLCGSQMGKTVGSIWYNSPVSVWGTNIKYLFAPDWSLGLGLYEVNPENALENRGFNLRMDETEGAIIPVELAWKPQSGAYKNLPGEYKIGGFYSTADATDLKTANNGEIQLAAKDREVHDHKYSLWLNAQQQLTQREGGNKNRGLYGTVNLTLNDSATNNVRNSEQIAFWYKGPFDSRPNDSVGFGIAHFDVNERLQDRQNYSNEINGLTVADYNNPKYAPIQRDEVDIELNYSYQWSPSVMLRPSLQYVYQPGGVKEVDDALVAGLSVKLNF